MYDGYIDEDYSLPQRKCRMAILMRINHCLRGNVTDHILIKIKIETKDEFATECVYKCD